MSTSDNNEGTRSYLQKALKINLDELIYGTFVEIGAGQEVARTFFQVGGASGTIAKTMSAYDMTFSDSIYGKEPSGRYVCESRLLKMLRREFELTLERLDGERGHRSLFFSFANTIATKRWGTGGEGHGWMGIRFLDKIRGEFNQLILHVRLLGAGRKAQQQTTGIIGVNLIYSVYFMRDNLEDFVESLMDGLDNKKIEIDMVKVEGPAFSHFNNHLLALELVKKEYTKSIFFDKNSNIVMPADTLYKKNVLLMRGSFRPPTFVNLDMLETGKDEFLKTEGVTAENTIISSEINFQYLESQAKANANDFLARVQLLCSLGQNVMISNYLEYYRLVSYISTFSKEKIGLILGHQNLVDVFNFDFYQDLPGKGLQALGILFERPVKMLVYPKLDQNDEFVWSNEITIDSKLKNIFAYFNERGQILDIKNANKKIMKIFSREVLELIKKGDHRFEEMVPKKVAELIKKEGHFEYPVISKTKKD